MAAEYDLDEGIDPTPLDSVDASVLLQLVRQALPRTNRGGLVYKDSVPSIGDNPRFSRYIWLDISGGGKPKLKLWNPDTTSWEALDFSSGDINGDFIQDLTVSLGKLDPTGGAALQLIRVNATATAFEFFTLTQGSVAANTIIPSGTSGDLLRTSLDGSTVEWFALNSGNIIGRINNGAIPITKIIPGAALTLPVTNDIGSAVGWAPVADILIDDICDTLDNGILPVSKLRKGTALQQIRTNLAATSVEWFTPAPSVLKYKTAAPLVSNIPAVSGVVSFAHGLVTAPDIFGASLQCIADEALTGYIAGDEIAISSVEIGGGAPSNGSQRFGVTADAINIKVICPAGDTYLFHKTTTVVTGPIDIAKWVIRAWGLVGGS